MSPRISLSLLRHWIPYVVLVVTVWLGTVGIFLALREYKWRQRQSLARHLRLMVPIVMEFLTMNPQARPNGHGDLVSIIRDHKEAELISRTARGYLLTGHDPWGGALRFSVSDNGSFTIRSVGPNGRDEFGKGDDVEAKGYFVIPEALGD